jgi:hypothetical protein
MLQNPVLWFCLWDEKIVRSPDTQACEYAAMHGTFGASGMCALFPARKTRLGWLPYTYLEFAVYARDALTQPTIGLVSFKEVTPQSL